MILINLLPHREAARKRRRENFYASLGAAALAGGLIAGAAFAWLQTQITDQQGKNSLLQAEIAALRARQQAVEDLQGDRNMPVHLLNELVRQMPDGIYLTSMTQDNRMVTVQGMAQSNERVSELLRNLGNNSPWLLKPELIEITASTVALSARDQRRVANFKLRVGIKRPTDDQKKDAPANATAPAAAKG